MRAEVETATPVYFQPRAPPAHLAGLVDLFWYWSGHARTLSANGSFLWTVELVIQLAVRAYAGISGPRSESFFIARREADALLGIHFKSGGAFPFLGGALGELHNTGVSLD